MDEKIKIEIYDLLEVLSKAIAYDYTYQSEGARYFHRHHARIDRIEYLKLKLLEKEDEKIIVSKKEYQRLKEIELDTSPLND